MKIVSEEPLDQVGHVSAACEGISLLSSSNVHVSTFFMKFISPRTLKYDVMYLLTFCSLAESRIKILKTKSRYKNEQTLKKRDKNYYWQMAFYELYIIIVSDS